MKIDERLKYQQLLDIIQFPAVIYIYETRRIIAINNGAKSILTPDGKLLRYMPDSEFRQQVSNQILNEKTDILLDISLEVGIREVHIDLEVNSLELDGKHMVIMLFDYTENHSFGDKFLNHVPRLFWKDKKLKLRGVNFFCGEDIRTKGIIFEKIEANHPNEAEALLLENETKIIKTKLPLWNVMQLIQTKDGVGRFMNIHRVPILNKYGTVIGILGAYNLIHSKTETEEEINWLKSEKTRLTKLLAINDSIFFRVRTDWDWSVEYVTPNIKQLGYTSKDFYMKKYTFRNIVLKEDLKRIVQEFITARKKGDRRVELEYRVKKADGSTFWVSGVCVYMDSDKVLKDAQYIDCIIRDISGIKTLQRELEASKDAMHAKIETIKKGEIPIKSVRFTDLFDMDDLLVTIKSFSDMMNISCTITDYVGRTLCDIIRKPYLEEETYQYYEEREGREIFRDLYKMVKNKKSNYFYDKTNKVYIYAFPFNVDDKCIGLLDILSKEEIPHDAPMMIFLNDIVVKLCSSVQKNMELFRERDRCENIEAQVITGKRKCNFLSRELEIAIAEDNPEIALAKIMRHLTQYIYVGKILLFGQTSELSYYEKKIEWNSKGEVNRRAAQVYELLNLRECEELVSLFKHTNIVTYQKKEIPEYLKRQFRSRKVKTLAMILLEFDLGENVIIAFCDRNTDSEWSNEKTMLLTDVSNIIKVVLQRIIIKKKISMVDSQRLQ